MFNKKFWRPTLLFIVLIELISFATFLLPELRIISFTLIASAFLIASLIDLKYGILIILTELIIGSKGGYLFSLEMDGSSLSIRITFWLILLSVWFMKTFLPAVFKKQTKQLLIINNTWFKYFGILMVFILWGLLNGFLNHNSFSNIFFDFNGYLYFLLIFPLFSILINKNADAIKSISNKIIQVASMAILWISAKTLILLFLFSHKLDYINSYLYSWVRTSGVGEITQVQGGFYRIFFQSHIFVLAAFTVFLIIAISFINNQKYKIKELIKNKQFIFLFSFLVILSMTSLVSMSRSNWVGFIISLGLIFIYSAWRFKLKGVITFSVLSATLFALSFVLVVGLVKFPYPKAIGGFATGDLFAERASEIKNEAGISSRWNLLPELSKEIKSSPLLGQGFGSTVTYISNDPRVRNNNIDGVYTTFAFEWGWLDTWLKMGILGFLSYILFLFVLINKLIKKSIAKNYNNNIILIAIAIILIALSAINFFSPYLNHPLGIGLILYSAFLMESLPIKKEKSKK
jgi:O-antigen ligase